MLYCAHSIGEKENNGCRKLYTSQRFVAGGGLEVPAAPRGAAVRSGPATGASTELAPFQPGAPLIHALARASTDKHAVDARIDRIQVSQELLQIKVKILQ